MNKLESGEEQGHGFLERALGMAKDVLGKATMAVPKDVAVSHECFGAYTEDTWKGLDSSNNGWFVGKIPVDKKDRQNSIYSSEFIRASLDFLFKQVTFGNRAQIVMAPCLSKYFNGAGDREKGLSNKDATALIKKIADDVCAPSFVSSQMDVHCMEELPLHKDFFDTLEKTFDKKKGVCDVEKAFGSEEEGDEVGNILKNPTSLEIAKFLYKASRENYALFQFFRHAAPEKIRADFDDEPCSKDYYALAEVSVRLSEILNGRYIHGGADRQGKYDDFIAEIVTVANPRDGKPVRKKSILLGLEPLIELFKGKRFETLHLDTVKNPHKVKVDRLRARINLAVSAICLVAAAVLPKFGVDFAREHQRKANMRDNTEVMMGMLMNVAKNTCLEHDQCVGGFRGIGPGPFLRNAINEGLYQISIRYGLHDDQIFEIQNIFLAFMLANNDSLSSIGDDNPKLVSLVDKFMQDPMARAKLGDMGITPSVPYLQLEPYKDELFRIANGGHTQQKVTGVGEDFFHCNAGVRAHFMQPPCPCEKAHELGVFSSSESYARRYEVAVCENGSHGDVLTARDVHGAYGSFIEWQDDRSFGEKIGDLPMKIRDWYYLSSVSRREEPFSSEVVDQKVAKSYVDTRRKAALALIPKNFSSFVYKACNPDSYAELDFSDSKLSGASVAKEYVYVVKDPFGEFEYEIYLGEDCKKLDGSYLCGKALFARKPGEQDFSFATAREFAQVYMNVMQAHWKSFSPNECKGVVLPKK